MPLVLLLPSHMKPVQIVISWNDQLWSHAMDHRSVFTKRSQSLVMEDNFWICFMFMYKITMFHWECRTFLSKSSTFQKKEEFLWTLIDCNNRISKNKIVSYVYESSFNCLHFVIVGTWTRRLHVSYFKYLHNQI